MIIYDRGSGLYETVIPIDTRKEFNVSNYQFEENDSSKYEFDLIDFKIKEKNVSRNIVNTNQKQREVH